METVVKNKSSQKRICGGSAMEKKWSGEVASCVQEVLGYIDRGDFFSIVKACDAVCKAIELEPEDRLLLDIHDGLLVQLGQVPASTDREKGTSSMAELVARAKEKLAASIKPQRKKGQTTKTAKGGQRKR
jgi:hypothetical protein